MVVTVVVQDLVVPGLICVYICTEKTHAHFTVCSQNTRIYNTTLKYVQIKNLIQKKKQSYLFEYLQ